MATRTGFPACTYSLLTRKHCLSVHYLGGATQDVEINKSPELSNMVYMRVVLMVLLLLLPGVGQNIPLYVSLTVKVFGIIIDRF